MGPDEVVLRKRAATVSLAVNVSLTVLKLFAAVLTGSLGMLSEAVHSASDIVASAMAYFSVRVSMAPPDDEHPYGHGKVETVAGFGESILLLAIAAYLTVESIRRLIHPTPIERLGFGAVVMVISAIASFVAGRYIDAIARRTDSLALKSNSGHMMSDFWTSLSVLIGLILYETLRWQSADAIMGLLIAAWLGKLAWGMTHHAFNELIDHRVDEQEVALIRSILADDPEVISFHRLRTRHSGRWHYIEVHIVVPREWSVVQAHDLADRLEKKVAAEIVPAHVVIHVDPFDPVKAGNPHPVPLPQGEGDVSER